MSVDVRIAGVKIPDKQLPYALRTIRGLGVSASRVVCKALDLDVTRRSATLTEIEVRAIEEFIRRNYVIEGDLVREVNANIKIMKDLRSRRGLRHIHGLPVNGQRTRTNARTRKGKAKPIANKKK